MITPGMCGQIEFLGNDDHMAGRLRDLGFVPGAIVSCVLQKSRRNIAAYLVRGAVIALREEDSRYILVNPDADFSENQTILSNMRSDSSRMRQEVEP